jgi:hypothetical protein
MQLIYSPILGLTSWIFRAIEQWIVYRTIQFILIGKSRKENILTLYRLEYDGNIYRAERSPLTWIFSHNKY